MFMKELGLTFSVFKIAFVKAFVNVLFFISTDSLSSSTKHPINTSYPKIPSRTLKQPPNASKTPPSPRSSPLTQPPPLNPQIQKYNFVIYLVHLLLGIEFLRSAEINHFDVFYIIFFLQKKVLRLQIFMHNAYSVTVSSRFKNLFYDYCCILLCEIRSFCNFIEKLSSMDKLRNNIKSVRILISLIDFKNIRMI